MKLFHCQNCDILAQELREQRMFFETLFKDGTAKALGTNYAEYKAVTDGPIQDANENEEDTDPYQNWDEVNPREVINAPKPINDPNRNT